MFSTVIAGVGATNWREWPDDYASSFVEIDITKCGFVSRPIITVSVS